MSARLIKARTALINERQGLTHEYGIVVLTGALTFRKYLLSTLAANDAKLKPGGLALFQQLEAELTEVEDRLARDDAQLTRLAHSHPVCQRLRIKSIVRQKSKVPETLWILKPGRSLCHQGSNAGCASRDKPNRRVHLYQLPSNPMKP